MKKFYKATIATIALFAATGTASAAVLSPAYIPDLSDIPDWTQIGNANPVTPSNILSTNGKFKYKVKRNGKVLMNYSAKKNQATVSLEDALGPSTPIERGSVVVKKGKITIKGVDPLGDPNKRVTLVTADYVNDASAFNLVFDTDPAGYDLFGVTTSNIECVSTWTFCTTDESFYVAGEFGNNPDNIRLKDGATAVTTIPVPAAFWLFGSGLLGLIGIARRKQAA